MIIDVNAYLGHFAFRRLRHNTAASLLALMDAKKIDKALVSSAAAITYRNAQAGNEEVAEETKGHRDRLIPFAALTFVLAGMASMGMPGFSGFPAELTILIGAWKTSHVWAMCAGVGVLVAAVDV